MSNRIQDDFEKQVVQKLLLDQGLSFSHLETVLQKAYCSQADLCDLFLEHTTNESWLLEDGIVKSGCFDVTAGAGLRVIAGEQTGFAYSDVITEAALLTAAQSAQKIIRNGQRGVWHPNLHSKDYKKLYQSTNPGEGFDALQKIKLLQEIDQYIRLKDERVVQVNAALASSWTYMLCAATDGTLAYDMRPLVRLSITVLLEANAVREQGFSGGGGRYSLDILSDPEVWQNMADQALSSAQANLMAVPAPAGTMDVVLGSGWPGVLIHEAVGHGLEGDAIRKQASAFSNKLGEQVASPMCTIVDDGTLAHKRGSLNVDDEGTPTQCTTLIENGRLVGFMHDKLSARLLKQKSTGNGRRESYAHLVLPRMTNTYLQPGSYEKSEIIQSVKKGLYAVGFNGGQVDTTSGKFVFAASEAYLIENGQITHPVKGATLIGDGPSALTRISMVGNDLRLDPGIGVCGKEGQSIEVGVGQPTIRINQLTVGGVA